MCLTCYIKEVPLFQIPKKINIKLCIDCGSYSKKEEWIKSTQDDILLIIKEAISRILLKKYLKKEMINFSILIDENTITFSSKDLINTILDGGIQHHYPFVMEDVGKYIEEIAYWLDLKRFPRKNYEDFNYV